jgi:hypothetical protein
MNKEKNNIEIGVIWEERKDLGSCNFCDKRDYRKVYEISGNTIRVRMCRKCLEELTDFVRTV